LHSLTSVMATGIRVTSRMRASHSLARGSRDDFTAGADDWAAFSLALVSAHASPVPTMATAPAPVARVRMGHIAHGSATARVMADQRPAASQQLSRYTSTGRAADCHDETIAAPAARTTPAMSIHHQGMPVTEATAVADQAVDAAMPAPMIGCLPGPN